MRFFKRLFEENDKIYQNNATKLRRNLRPYKTKNELIERYGGEGLDKQIDFVGIIGVKSWCTNLEKAEICFGENLVFPIQVIGTFSHSTSTWLWAWADKEFEFLTNIKQHALELKKYGEENEIDLLIDGKFDVQKSDIHLIGLIASGIFTSSGYYIANSGDRSMVVTIKSKKIDRARKDNHQRIFTVFPQLISLFEMNHNIAFINYLIARGYTVSESKNKLTGTKNGNVIIAKFDEQSRLIKLEGSKNEK
ncbi:DUF6882 domain-containing protein [Flavobacterium sp. FlaQc-57]|uniref:DUF6882 domain-containing protein n=1 Tax=Flavobacterium sp. FlaQc-57 TaxID=3374186 RepID=UPI00375763D9